MIWHFAAGAENKSLQLRVSKSKKKKTASIKATNPFCVASGRKLLGALERIFLTNPSIKCQKKDRKMGLRNALCHSRINIFRALGKQFWSGGWVGNNISWANVFVTLL
jgi:hypothetical protein